jgi:hypothetical protein
MVLIFQDVVAEIAMKWTKIMKTGGIRVQFSGVDLSTIMFSMDQGRDTMEVKRWSSLTPEFVLIMPN